MEDKDILLLLVAHNARFRISSRLTTKNQTGYDIRPECDLFGRKNYTSRGQHIPAGERLASPKPLHQSPPFDTTYEALEAIPLIHQRTRRFFLTVLRHVGSLPEATTHEDIENILEVLENESV